MKTKNYHTALALYEIGLYRRHLEHSKDALTLLEAQNWDGLLVKLLSAEASIAALRHWIMHNRMGIDLEKDLLN